MTWCCGQVDHARKLLEQELKLVRSASGAQSMFCELVLSEALTLAALDNGRPFPSLRSPVRSATPIQTEELERDLAELMARGLAGCPRLSSHLGSYRTIFPPK